MMRRLRLHPPSRSATPARTWPLVVAALLCGCRQAMDDQPKYEVFEPTDAHWEQPARQPVEGTIARGMPIEPVPEAIPYEMDEALLARGRERYGIYCAPCHSPVGDGQGMIVQRGFPAPPSYHVHRLRAAPDRHFYDVITHGYGIMYSYAGRVTPADRWAIVAYIRALQLSQHAPAEMLPAGRQKARQP